MMHNIVENQVRELTSSQIVKVFEDHCKALAFIPRKWGAIGELGIGESGHLIPTFK